MLNVWITEEELMCDLGRQQSNWEGKAHRELCVRILGICKLLLVLNFCFGHRFHSVSTWFSGNMQNNSVFLKEKKCVFFTLYIR